MVLPRGGDTEEMTDVDQMVLFCLLSKRRINLVRLILDFILSSVHTERRSNFTLPYGMLLTRVFEQAQLRFGGHKSDDSRPPATVDTFVNLRLKPKDPEKKTKKKKKGSKNLVKKNWKKKLERSLSPIPERKIGKK